MRSGSEGVHEEREREREHPKNILRGRMLCRNFERREIEGECLKDCGRRQSTFWPPNACTRSPVRSFVRLHFQKLLARLFALCGGRGRKRGRGPHSAWKTVRASETLRSDPSLPEGTWHSDAYILGLIGHGIRANKHRPSSRRDSGSGMHAVSNGSEEHTPQ